MLVLTRRTGESLKIGDNITVTVLGCQGNQIKIGVEAPRDVQVHREEVYHRVSTANTNVTPISTVKRKRRRVLHENKPQEKEGEVI